MSTLLLATTVRVPVLSYGTEDVRWAAVRARDAKADGHFVYGVRTTGVYCRPSAASRLPRRENIEFFDSAEAAEAAGYRASQRLAADRTAASAQRARLVAQACRHIEQAESPPALDELADGAGLSPWHFHRVFKAETGLTPKAYADAARARRLRDELLGSATVTDAIYDAGFNASSRFYEQSDALLGMSPRDWRGGGANTRIRFAVGQCSLGAILVAQSVRGICAISLGDDADQLVRDLQDRFPKAELTGAEPEFDELVASVVGFVEQPSLGLDLPLDVRGTAFQQRVWQALQQIPAGETATYSEIAERIGSPKAVRAVGQACGANLLAVAIPCHRVVRRGGDLSGYRWGIDRKRALLLRERSGC
ncbi:bifunctional DNA-binding transcriptional regulator/O6-methylguanine-DNA methyltransferase Ada [Alcaligenaceae bacterium]|nr:bifunctional DNA-binding transcriptional regulator/O6-methylguanine-DNA methyltransferase Ada [Alcaligenaceae bacterium]